MNWQIKHVSDTQMQNILNIRRASMCYTVGKEVKIFPGIDVKSYLKFGSNDLAWATPCRKKVDND